MIDGGCLTVGKKNPFCQKAIIAIERVNHTQGEHRKSKTIVKWYLLIEPTEEPLTCQGHDGRRSKKSGIPEVEQSSPLQRLFELIIRLEAYSLFNRLWKPVRCWIRNCQYRHTFITFKIKEVWSSPKTLPTEAMPYRKYQDVFTMLS